MAEWLAKPKSLRTRLHDIPALNPAGLRDCQIAAIQNLEKSFRDNRLRVIRKRHKRKATWDAENNLEGRWRKFS